MLVELRALIVIDLSYQTSDDNMEVQREKLISEKER